MRWHYRTGWRIIRVDSHLRANDDYKYQRMLRMSETMMLRQPLRSTSIPEWLMKFRGIIEQYLKFEPLYTMQAFFDMPMVVMRACCCPLVAPL